MELQKGRVSGGKYGFTINAYIIRLWITKSKQLLRFSGMTVEEISYECGINSPRKRSFFSGKIKNSMVE